MRTTFIEAAFFDACLEIYCKCDGTSINKFYRL